MEINYFTTSEFKNKYNKNLWNSTNNNNHNDLNDLFAENYLYKEILNFSEKMMEIKSERNNFIDFVHFNKNQENISNNIFENNTKNFGSFNNFDFNLDNINNFNVSLDKIFRIFNH